MDATYHYKITDKVLYDKQEYRAKKWKIKSLIPLYELEELANKGYKYYYEYAEALGVTEDLVEKAYEYYKGY